MSYEYELSSLLFSLMRPHLHRNTVTYIMERVGSRRQSNTTMQYTGSGVTSNGEISSLAPYTLSSYTVNVTFILIRCSVSFWGVSRLFGGCPTGTFLWVVSDHAEKPQLWFAVLAESMTSHHGSCIMTWSMASHHHDLVK